MTTQPKKVNDQSRVSTKTQLELLALGDINQIYGESPAKAAIIKVDKVAALITSATARIKYSTVAEKRKRRERAIKYSKLEVRILTEKHIEL